MKARRTSFSAGLAVIVISLTLVGTASASSSYGAFGNGLEIYPQQHGERMSLAWDNSCYLLPATGPFVVHNGGFKFMRVLQGHGIAAKGSINHRTVVGEIRAWSPHCNTGWVHFVARK